jgi:hypothetical protein
MFRPGTEGPLPGVYAPKQGKKFVLSIFAQPALLKIVNPLRKFDQEWDDLRHAISLEG